MQSAIINTLKVKVVCLYVFHCDTIVYRVSFHTVGSNHLRQLLSVKENAVN